MDPQLDRVLVEARARSIDVREEIGSTAYCASYAVGDALVMRIPRSQFPVELRRGQGPFTPEGGIDSPVLAQKLLELSTERQRGIDRGPLARFVDRLELGGVPVALHERAVGRRPMRGDLSAIARALVELHEVLGYHGHLVPAHIAVDGDTVTFTDPLPPYPRMLGGVGYALPIFATELAPRDEGMLLRDVAAIASITADAYGVDLGWSVEVATFLDDVNHGLSRPWDPQPALAELYVRTQDIDDGWIAAVGRLGIDHYMPVPSVRPTTTQPRAAIAGTARSLLERSALHGTLGTIARALQTSPSLFDFVALERAAAIESQDTRPDPAIAFNAREVSFAAILEQLPALRAAYAGAAPVAVTPIEHHRDVFAESYALRTLLLDLDRLLAPTPETFAMAAGLLARVDQSIDELREPTRLMVATRRYVNYVSNPNRVF